MVMPSREAAAPVLARLHIGQSKKAWNLDEQAKFVLAQLTSGITIEQLKSQLPAIKDVPRVVRMGRVRDRLRATKFSSKEISDYVAGPKLAMSSFEYAYRNPSIQALIGLEFDGESRIHRWADSPAQLFALERLLSGFRAGELNTRRGLKAGEPGYDQLVAEMSGATNSASSELLPRETAVPEFQEPAPTPEAIPAPEAVPLFPLEPASPPTTPTTETNYSPTPSDPLTLLTPQTNEPPAPLSDPRGAPRLEESAPRGPNAPETKSNLSTAGIPESSLALPLQHRLRELRRISATDFPAATAMLVRSVVEASIKEHYGLANGIDVSGTLGDVMTRVTSDYKENGQLANAISTLNRTKKNASDVPGSGQWFNLVSHSVNIDATGADVHKAWRVVYPLVRFMLTEQPSPH